MTWCEFYMSTRYNWNCNKDLGVPRSSSSRHNNFSFDADGFHGMSMNLYTCATSDQGHVKDFEQNKNNVSNIDCQHNRDPFTDSTEFIVIICDKDYNILWTLSE